MRCPSCNKFPSLEFQDPEIDGWDASVSDPEVEDGTRKFDVHAECNVRIVRTSECCGEECKEANLELSADSEFSLAAGEHEGEGHGEFSIDEPNEAEQVEEGGGRYAKSYFGALVHVAVTCECGETVHEFDMSDKVAASEMEELA